MFIEPTENDLKNRIEAKEVTAITEGKLEVELLPENETAFKRPTSKGRISICFFKAEFAKSEAIDAIAQACTNRFEIFIMAKAKRGDFGIYDLYDRCRKAIIGYEPAAHKKFFATKMEYWLRESGLWIYRFEVGGECMLVEKPDEPEEFGNLMELTFEPPAGNAAQLIVVTSEET